MPTGDMRTSTIQIQEYGAHTVVNVNANERIEFSLTIAPKKFADPRVTELEKIVESQRNEITNALDQNSVLEAQLLEAKRPKKARRR